MYKREYFLYVYLVPSFPPFGSRISTSGKLMINIYSARKGGGGGVRAMNVLTKFSMIMRVCDIDFYHKERIPRVAKEIKITMIGG